MRFLPAFAILGLLSAPAARGAQLALRDGRVSMLTSEGGPWVENPATPRALLAGDRVRSAAGSAARVALEDGSTLMLGADSELVLAESNPLSETVRLIRGSLWTSVGVNSAGFEVLVPGCRVLPSFGRVNVEVRSGGRAGVGVPEGLAKVVCGSAEGLLLGDGQTLRLSNGRPLLSPEALAKLARRGEARPGPEPAEEAVPPLRPAPEPGPAAARKSGPGIPELLAALERDPGDPGARAALNQAVNEFQVEQSRLAAALRAALSDEERRAMLRRTYPLLAERIADDAVRGVFLDGHAAFEDGKYLVAAERFVLCRLLASGEPWLRAALDDYLGSQIPDAAESAARGMPMGSGRDYRSVGAAILGLRWEEALAGTRRAGGAAGGEFRALADRLYARARPDDGGEDREEGVLRVLRSVERNPVRALEDLESLLARHHAERSESWWQKAAEGLRRAYFQTTVHRLRTQAQHALSSGDFKGATRLLVRLLRNDPENPQGVALLDKMEEQAEKRLRIATVGTGAAAPPKARRPSPRPAAAEPAPREPERALVAYKAGLIAFVAEDFALAHARFLEAVTLDPELDKARAALAGVDRRLDLQGKGGARK